MVNYMESQSLDDALYSNSYRGDNVPYKVSYYKKNFQRGQSRSPALVTTNQ